MSAVPCRSRLWIGVWLLWTAGFLQAAEVIPPAPARYFNDYARAIPVAVGDQLNRQLEQFEKETTTQIIAVLFPKLQSDSSVEDYTVRVAEAWKVGQPSRNNGAVLFVFLEDRQIYISVGYGLEGALPDATAKVIVEQEIKPRFRTGDYAGGMQAGLTAMMQATRGEYRGTGATLNSRNSRRNAPIFGPLIFFIILFLMFSQRRRRGRVYSGGGSYWGGGPWIGGGGWGGGGSWGGGGGGGFSGGGGSFGGGGAGGRW